MGRVICTYTEPKSEQAVADGFAALAFTYPRRASLVHRGTFHVEGVPGIYAVKLLDEKRRLYAVCEEENHEDQDPHPLD